MPVVTRSQARKNKMGSQKTIAEWTAENKLREWNARDHRQPLAQRPVLIDESSSLVKMPGCADASVASGWSTVENKLREWHLRYHRQQLAQRPVLEPSPVKIDFSKVKSRPVSESFVFPKSTEQKLEEALVEIAELKKKQEMMENEFREYKNHRE